jgi:hypothetical protein
MVALSMKRLAEDVNSIFLNLPILLENASYYSLLTILIADAETISHCDEYSH